jgi:hypothetical protein
LSELTTLHEKVEVAEIHVFTRLADLRRQLRYLQRLWRRCPADKFRFVWSDDLRFANLFGADTVFARRTALTLSGREPEAGGAGDMLFTLMRRLAQDWQRVNFLRWSNGPILRFAFIVLDTEHQDLV